MKLIIERNKLSSSPEQVLRRAGYGFIRDSVRDKESYVRRLGNYHYPRLHMYIKTEGGKVVFDLHLDQKQASYSGSHMHNAEYEGPVVEAEIDRIREFIFSFPSSDDRPSSPWDRLRQETPAETDKEEAPKKGWIERFFN